MLSYLILASSASLLEACTAVSPSPSRIRVAAPSFLNSISSSSLLFRNLTCSPDSAFCASIFCARACLTSASALWASASDDSDSLTAECIRCSSSWSFLHSAVESSASFSALSLSILRELTSLSWSLFVRFAMVEVLDDSCLAASRSSSSLSILLRYSSTLLG